MQHYGMVHLIRALAISRNDRMNALEFVTQNYGPTSQEAQLLKRSLIDTGAIDSPADAMLRELGGSFVAGVRKRSLLGQMRDSVGVRIVEPYRNYLFSDGTVAAGWVAEGGPILPASEGFRVQNLAPLKLATLLVTTDEFIRTIGGNSDAILERDMTGAIVAATNEALVSDDDGSGGTRPPGLFSAAQVVNPTGNNIPADLAALLDGFEGDLARSVLVANPGTAARLALYCGSDAFGSGGGFVAGITLLTAPEIATGFVGLVDCSQLELVDLGITPDASSQALVFQSVTDGAGVQPLSLWPENLYGLKATSYVNWRLTDPEAYARYIPDLSGDLANPVKQSGKTTAARKGA
ncbi:phage major capsid protein [Paraburkholderia sp. JPY303]|uniref:phage major capsid protein n=1 Tax=Paraburkholderia atlantica TaxID=2654982 RepID=UPI001C37C812|nr:phage major capsid protein [Paraburkholderia atlantica]NUY32979.1 phage major capsid protein [Paraburkholderia atlantica]